MSARIRGAKTELQELGEEEDEFTQSTSKLQGLVKSLTGFDIMKDKDTFKDIYDIIIGIGEAWPSLKDIDKASLGEALAGKRGANGLFAVLDNLDTLKSAYETAENSAGSAAREQANYEKSIQYSLDRLGASAQEFATTFLSSDFVKGIVDIGNAFLEAVTKANDFAGSLTMVSTIISGILAATGKFKIFDADTKSFGFSGGAGGKTLVSKADLDLFKEYNIVLDQVKKDFGEYGSSVDMVAEAKRRLSEQGRTLSSTFEQEANSAGEAGISIQGFTTRTKLAAIGMTALNTAINAAIGFGIGLLFQGLITGLDHIINASKYAEQSLDELVGSLDKMEQSTKDSGKWVDENAQKFVELSKGVDALGRNIALTDDEYKTYISLSNEAGELFPQMITYWDDMGNKIITAAGGLEDFNKAQKQKEEDDRKTLADSYDELKKGFDDGEYDTNGKTIKRKDAKNKISTLRKLIGGSEKINKYGSVDPDHAVGGGIGQDKSAFGIDEINEYIEQLAEDDKKKVKEAIDRLGDSFTLDELKKEDVEAYEILRRKIDDGLVRLQNDLYHSPEAEKVAKSFQSVIQRSLAYDDLPDDLKEVADTAIGLFDSEMLSGVFESGLGMSDSEIQQWVTDNIITPLKDGLDPDDLPNLVQMLFTTKEEDYSSYYDYFEAIKNIILTMLSQKIPADVINQWLKKAGLAEGFGTVGTDGSVNSMFDTAYNKYAHIAGSKEYINSLSKEEISGLIKTNDTEASSMSTLDQLKNKVALLRTETEKASEAKKTFDEVWNATKEDDEAKKDSLEREKSELLELAKAGKLTEKALRNNSFGKEIIDQAGISAEEATFKINNLVSEIERIGELQDHINSLEDVVQEKKTNKDHKVNPNTLKKTRDDLGVNTWSPKDLKAWKEYEKVAMDSTATTKQFRKATNDLITTYINANKYLTSLTEASSKADKKLAESELKKAGVTNAKEAVEEQARYNTYQLVNAKLESAEASGILANGTQDEIKALGDELIATGATKKEISSYMIELIKAGAISLNTSGSIANLQALIQQLGYTASAAQQYATYMAQLSSYSTTGGFVDAGGNNHYLPSDAAKGTLSMNEQIAKNATKSNKVKKPTVPHFKIKGTPTKNTNKDKGSPSKSDSKKTKQYIDWIERRITRINNIIGNIQAKIENIGKWTFGKKMSLSNSKDNKNLKEINAQLDKEIKYYKTLYNVQKAARGKYQKKADSIAKKNKKILTKSVINKIQSGKYNSNSFKKWYQGLSDKQKNVVDQYIEFYDKGKQANQGMKESVKAAREAKIQKAQNKQDLYDKRVSRAETKEEYYVGADRKNKFVEIQLDNLKKSYAQQKEIAKLNGDYAEYERLTYEEKTKQRELLYHEIENIKDEYEILRGVNDRRIQDADNLLSIAEAEGRRVNTGWYTSKNINERKNYDYWSDERKKILEKLDGLEEGSTEWNNAMNDLQETENGMTEAQKNIADNTSAIRQIVDDVYNEMVENNNRFYDNAKFLAGLQRGENINTADRNDSYYRFTDTGLANMAAARTGIGVAMSNQSLYLEQKKYTSSLLDDIKKKGLSGKEADEYIKNLNDPLYSSYDQLEKADKEYTELWKKNREAQAEAENTLIDLMKEYYEGQKAYLSEIIDARKKILDEEKDLYDYEKNINEKTKNIATLQKRLAAIQGDNSEAGKARRQQIQAQLDQAQQDLQDAEYERWKSDQEAMLDNLSTQYNDIVDRHLKNPEALLSEAKDFLSDNNSKITAIEQGLKNSLPDGIRNEFNDVLDMDLSTIGNKLDGINSNLTTYLQEQKDARNNATEQPGGSQGDPTGKNPKPSGSVTGDTISSGTIEGKASLSTNGSFIYEITKSDLKKMIKDAGGKKGKDSKDYSALNTLLYKATGYILPDHSVLKKFYKIANGTTKGFDDKFGKDGILYKILKESGFKTGGIGRLVKASGEDGFAMVRNGEGFVAPESVNAVQQWMNTAPDMTAMLNMINKNGGIGGTTNIGEMNFELPNVTDARSLIETFQNSKDMQRLLKIGVEDLMGQGKFSNKIFTV